jgi:hypothetical protein
MKPFFKKLFKSLYNSLPPCPMVVEESFSIPLSLHLFISLNSLPSNHILQNKDRVRGGTKILDVGGRNY